MKRIKYLDVSLCVSCMNRNENIEIALQTWLFLPVQEILIVDWSCKKPLNYLLQEDKRIKIIRVENKKYYHHSAANNLKYKYAQNNYILGTDADVLIQDEFFSAHELHENIFYKGNGHTNFGVYGVFLGHKKWLEICGGYNERMCYGWGHEDDDLYQRLEKLEGLEVKDTIRHYCIHIPHSDKLRVENQKEKLMVNSRSKNILVGMEQPAWTARDKKLELNEIIFTN